MKTLDSKDTQHYRFVVPRRRKVRDDSSPHRIPRISRLMALAIRFEGLLQDDVVHDYADLARLGHVTRARITQIMNLTYLAPDIQEALLLLPPVQQGNDPVRERDVRPIAAVNDWNVQRRRWTRIKLSRRLPNGHDGSCDT